MQQIGKYKVIQQVSVGAQAFVYEVRDPNTAAKLAIKYFTQPNAQTQQEINYLRQLQGQHGIAALIDYQDETQHYLVMPYYENSWQRQLEEAEQDPSKLKEPAYIHRVLAQARALLNTLAELHKRNVLHGDISPSNIMLSQDDLPVLIDFELTQELPSKRGNTRIQGNKVYTCPKVRSGHNPSLSADLYSFAALTCRLLTLSDKFNAISALQKQLSMVPTELAQLLISALDKNPEKRPSNALVMARLWDRAMGANDDEKTQTWQIPESSASGAVSSNFGYGLLVTGIILALSGSWYSTVDQQELTHKVQLVETEERENELIPLGELRVERTPSDAQLLLIDDNAQTFSISAAGSASLPYGTYKLTVSKNGYDSSVQQLQIDDSPLSLSVNLPLSDSRYFIGNTDPRTMDGVGLEFILLPSASDAPQIRMMAYEVTNALYNKCIEAKVCPTIDRNPQDKRDQLFMDSAHPVVWVSWYDVTQSFIPWLANITGTKLRLPTEREWMRAATAGESSKFAWGNTFVLNAAHCRNCSSTNLRVTQVVGRYPANQWQLFDMHGNVQEWTADCWQASAAASVRCDQAVVKGGSWLDSKERLAVSARSQLRKDVRSHTTGFRLVEEVGSGE